ncbi:unnamed protein product [Phytomonas sp. Hart1]|nr:unnamed protein product [Phytomonas sp. Hart1]|eukprot:CCW71307.1 unnamed protein product [Phytomonas sp. isolate Hart1]
MKFPCARHLANHLYVQELALAAALTSTDGDPSLALSGARGGDALFRAARRVATLSWAVEELLSYGPHRLRLDPPAQVLLLRRLHAMGEGEQRPLAAPAYHVALYGPYAPLPSLPNYLHDDVSYDEACHHAALIQRLLEPYGLVVQLNGATRRGAPIGRVAEFSLSLTEAAAREIELQQIDTQEDEEHTSTQMSPRSNDGEERVKHNSFILPSEPSPRIAPVGGNSGDSPLLDHAAQELLRQLPFLWCSSSEAASSTDVVPSRVKFRYTRAIQELFRSGYVAAGRMPTEQHWHEKRRCTKIFSVRFDPFHPTEIPPLHVRDPAMRERMKLHQVELDIMPWDAMHVRRFFRTGPAAFTTHVTLSALKRGLELNLNGLFLYYSPRESERESNQHDPKDFDTSPTLNSISSMNRKRLLIQSERDIFQLVGLPYIDPFTRAIYCQKNDIMLTDDN